MPAPAATARALCPCLALALVLVSRQPAGAQSRHEAARRQRAAKAADAQPYEPGRLEAALIRLEEGRYLQRLFAPPEGLYPRIGGIVSGAGVAVGPGYRKPGWLGGRVDLNASGAVSHKRYVLAEAGASLPRLARGRAFADLLIRARDLPEEDFFGLGIDAPRGARTTYRLRDVSVGGGGGLRLTPWLTVGQRVEAIALGVGRGRDDRFPSTEQRFSEAEAPGLADPPGFARYESFLNVDYAIPAPNPRAGGRYLLSFSRFDDRGSSRYAFRRFEADLRQYVPLLHGHRVLVLRAVMSLSEPDAGAEVPFFFQRWLGGSHSVRAFRSYRFRDRNLLLLQAEYRFEVLPVLEAALFYDAGTVARDREDLTFDRMKDAYGFGLRFGGPYGIFLRTDVAFGGEGPRFLLRFNHVF